MTRRVVSAETRARMAEAAHRSLARQRGFAVPGWVRSVGLVEDFVDVAQEHGEEAAASVCRALKRAMTVPAP